MARQLERWIEAMESPDSMLLSLLMLNLPKPFPLEWYRANPRLAIDRLAEFKANPDFTPCYDEGDF